MNVLKELMAVLRIAPTAPGATPAPVLLVLFYRLIVADAMVNFNETDNSLLSSRLTSYKMLMSAKKILMAVIKFAQILLDLTDAAAILATGLTQMDTLAMVSKDSM